jgi:hypothetical protein
VADRQSPQEALEALFSHATAVDRPDPNVLPVQWHMCSAAVAVLEVVGLITEKEAKSWRERLDAEGERRRESALTEPPLAGPRAWADADAKEAGFEFLAGTLETTSHHREAMRRLRSATGSTDLLSRGYGAIEALRAVGLLDDRERQEWSGRFGEVAARTMPEATRTITPPQLTAVHAVRATGTAAVQHSKHAPPRIPSMPPTFSGRSLRRVLLIESAGIDRDARPRLIEFYDDGVVLDWMKSKLNHDRHASNLHPRIELRDELGTDYLFRGGGGGGFGEMLRMRDIFVPAVPASAATLEVQLDDVCWRIPL